MLYVLYSRHTCMCLCVCCSIELQIQLCVCCSIELQIQLVQAYWSELFVIGLAQCAHVMNLSTILAAILNHLQTRLLHGKKHYAVCPVTSEILRVICCLNGDNPVHFCPMFARRMLILTTENHIKLGME